MTEPLRLRAGRSVGRTLYQVNPDGTEMLIGMVDTPELAAQVVTAVNGVPAEQDLGWLRDKHRHYAEVIKAQRDRGRIDPEEARLYLLYVGRFMGWLQGTSHPGEGR